VTEQRSNDTNAAPTSEDKDIRFPDRSALRASLPPATESASESVREIRREWQEQPSQSEK